MTAIPIKTDVLAKLPAEGLDGPLPSIRRALRESRQKLVVLDDDPTGTQTVYDIPVLTEWPVKVLCNELSSETPAFYLLTNTRSMSLTDAQTINHEIGMRLIEASRKTKRPFVVASRSDSTLRGHFPGETDALAEALGGFDAILLIPAFIAAGRYTLDDVHYLVDGENLLPVRMTEFAGDAVFGYQASNMREWVEEKTKGRVKVADVASISLGDIREGRAEHVTESLLKLKKGTYCVVMLPANAISPS
jgi:uncharacterized protein YgbK (DUF1537 family)